MPAKLLQFRSTYRSILEQLSASGFEIKIAGTLDGFVDLAITESDGKHRTYNISPEEAKRLSGALLKVVDDIQRNCLYDRDALLQSL